MLYKNNKGFVVPTIIITVFCIITVALAVLGLAVANNQNASREVYRVNAQFAADSGLDVGVQALNANETWTGTAETTLYQDSKLKLTYTTSVLSGQSTDKKVIRSVGRVYSPANASSAVVTRIYELDVQAVTSGTGITSVVSGVGGLILNNNSRITGGDVVVNGTIAVNNNAQIGLSTTDYINHPEQVVNVRVAHTNCPNPVTSAYPRVCAINENGQPISVTGKIYGNVQATNQTTNTNMSNPGLIANQVVTPYTLPSYDRNAQKTAVTATYSPSDNVVTCSNNQTKSWPANIKITGNISLGNNCTITLMGNVWITGNLTVGGGTKFIVPDSLGTNRPVIMIDGQSGLVFGNNNTITPNSSGNGVYVLTYWCGASCSPDSTSVTGATLASSQSVVTLELSNNSSAPGSILYARWSKVRISNNGSIGAVAGQTIELGNNAVINFTASVPGSSNLSKTWVKRGYLRVFK